MLINAIDLVSLLVFLQAWIVRIFFRFIFVLDCVVGASHDLAPGYVMSNRTVVTNGGGIAYPTGASEFVHTFHLGMMFLNLWYSL